MKNWLSLATSGAVGGVAAGMIIALLLGHYATTISDMSAKANPTCDDPRGLAPIKSSEITPTGWMHPHGAHEPTDIYSPKAATDGFGGSIWVPPIQRPEKGASKRQVAFDSKRGRNVLTLDLRSRHDVKLVCAVNGLANTYTNYVNWGRVRTITTWGDDKAVMSTTTLRSMGSDDFPNPQVIARNVGTTKSVHIELDDAFVGQTVETYDPDLCFRDGAPKDVLQNPDGLSGEARYAPGCIIAATRLAGLADVYLYEPAATPS